MFKLIHEVNSPNPKIKEYVSTLSEEAQTTCWEFYNFLINTIPESKKILFGELKSREEGVI